MRLLETLVQQFTRADPKRRKSIWANMPLSSVAADNEFRRGAGGFPQRVTRLSTTNSSKFRAFGLIRPGNQSRSRIRRTKPLFLRSPLRRYTRSIGAARFASSVNIREAI